MSTTTDLPGTASAPQPELTWRDLSGVDHDRLRRAAADLAETALSPVKTAVVSPAGFDTFEDDGSLSAGRVTARIVTDADGQMHVVGDDDTAVASFARTPVFTARDVAALRPYSGVRVPATAGSGPRAQATLLMNLLVAGVPVAAPQLPTSVGVLLGRELADMVRSLGSNVMRDIEQRERWSVHARRLALLTATAGGAGSARPAVTAIVASDGSSGVDRLIRQLRTQSWPAVEVVRAPGGHDAVLHALQACLTPLATLATVELQYGPDHLTDLVLATEYSRRPVVGVRVRRRYLEALDLTVCLPGRPTEQPSAQLTAGTVLGSPAELLARGVVGTDLRDLVDLGEDGYAIHDLGVAIETSRGDADGRDDALRAATRQAPGHPWLEPTAGPDPAYTSYFARSDSRSA